ncbi:hypothetical protein [Deinococcus humi]|uniref:Uncharacterized protein n=1 Tax=Deinococcus humi TaxID=662880 RepID=A0A7W8NCB7_9DEIO|nr:hypothetical protein [Deinococcus humi]MBB5361156.1 hypothetical protein [Deinococcus humi]
MTGRIPASPLTGLATLASLVLPTTRVTPLATGILIVVEVWMHGC